MLASDSRAWLGAQQTESQMMYLLELIDCPLCRFQLLKVLPVEQTPE